VDRGVGVHHNAKEEKNSERDGFLTLKKEGFNYLRPVILI